MRAHPFSAGAWYYADKKQRGPPSRASAKQLAKEIGVQNVTTLHMA